MVTVGQNIYNTVILLVYKFLAAIVTREQLSNEIKYISIKEAVVGNGYPFEEYQLQTQDGYLLTMHRIPHGRNKDTNITNQRQAVFFQHGIVSCAYDWLILGAEFALPYQLADRGYDVWLGNSRGNRYSRQHVDLNPDEPAFWRFSYHEVGYYDIPAMIDYILNTTKQKDLYVIGHSQGSTAMLVAASERPEYIKHIRLFVACAPVVHSQKMPSFVVEVFATFYKQFLWFIYTYNYQEFLPRDELILKVLRLFCDDDMPYRRLCWLLARINFGYSNDYESIPARTYLQSMPGGASLRQMAHFIQNKLSDTFSQYDHGLMLNYIKYGKSYPPKYNLKTRLPTAIIYSDNDWASTVEDIQRTSAQMKNVIFMHKTNFAHVDYVFGRNASIIMLPIITKLLEDN